MNFPALWVYNRRHVDAFTCPKNENRLFKANLMVLNVVVYVRMVVKLTQQQRWCVRTYVRRKPVHEGQSLLRQVQVVVIGQILAQAWTTSHLRNYASCVTKRWVEQSTMRMLVKNRIKIAKQLTSPGLGKLLTQFFISSKIGPYFRLHCACVKGKVWSRFRELHA